MQRLLMGGLEGTEGAQQESTVLVEDKFGGQLVPQTSQFLPLKLGSFLLDRTVHVPTWHWPQEI